MGTQRQEHQIWYNWEIVIDLDKVNGKVARSPTKVRDEVIRDIKVVWESVMGLAGFVRLIKGTLLD